MSSGNKAVSSQPAALDLTGGINELLEQRCPSQRRIFYSRARRVSMLTSESYCPGW